MTFNNNKWDVQKTQQTIWQILLEYAKIARYTAWRDADKATICDDILGKFNKAYEMGSFNTHKTLNLSSGILEHSMQT